MSGFDHGAFTSGRSAATDYPADKIMKEFDVTSEKAKAGHINTEELKNLLQWLPAKLEDGGLDSLEIDSLIQQLHKMVVFAQK